jgi:hypothetical protein
LNWHWFSSGLNLLSLIEIIAFSLKVLACLPIYERNYMHVNIKYSDVKLQVKKKKILLYLFRQQPVCRLFWVSRKIVVKHFFIINVGKIENNKLCCNLFRQTCLKVSINDVYQYETKSHFWTHTLFHQKSVSL